MNVQDLPNNVKAVIDRLAFIDDLYSKRREFQGELAFNVDLEIHPFHHFYSLINYLLITCLDTLSEKEMFKEFDVWISNINGEEYDKLDKALMVHNADKKKIICDYYSKYKEKFSIRKSMKNLIFNSFNSDHRTKLFNSIRLYKAERITNATVQTKEITSEIQKFDVLYNIRNKFTHSSTIINGAVDFSNLNSTSFALLDGNIHQLQNISTKFNVVEEKYTGVHLIGWPIVGREILADYIFSEFNFDIRLKYKIIKSFNGKYNFDLLWAENEKILCAKKPDKSMIYLGGSAFKTEEEAIYYMACKVSDAIQLDKAWSKGGSQKIVLSEFHLLGPINNIIGQIISSSGKIYYIRYDKRHKVFLYSLYKGSSDWNIKETTETDYNKILIEAEKHINSLENL